MRLPLLTAALLVGSPLGLAFAQVPTAQSSGQVPAVKAPLKTPPAKVVGNPTPQTLTSSLVGGSDNCASAAANDSIVGVGTFAVNNTGATSGAPIGSCGLMGRDVWFYWTATSNGNAFISTCGGVSGDSVIAVWNDGAPAGSCPTTQVLCLDDFCGLQTQVSFPVTAGQKFFIEIGGFNSQTFSGTFNISIPVPPANDNCATPTIIAGSGPHAFDNTVASTGVQGQNEGICTFFGSPAINNDVWYRWTSGFTGTARIETCGSFIDTKIAAYAGAGCPAGAALGCNDDACGLQTRTDFSVVAGGVYTIQVGLYPFTQSGGSSSFTINPFVPAVNDNCLTPTVVVGNGPHLFDNSIATTGTQGQGEALCFAFGTSALNNDIWYTWTATATSTFEVSLCGSTTFDSRVAVYAGVGCPAPGSALACNDDFCGLVSTTCFSAVAGQQYTIQIGAYSAAGLGTGDFVFTPTAPPSGGCAPTDDGTSENALGWTVGGTLVWMTGFGAPAQSATVSSVETTYATPLFPGGYIPQGNVTVAVWDDPNDDGNPNDLVLLGTGTAVVNPGSIDSDVFQTITLTSPVIANGVFFVGAAVTHNQGEFVAPIDQGAGGGSACGSGPGSWFFGANAPTVDLTNPSGNQYPPATLASALGTNGNWLVRPNCGPGSTGTAYCFGDGTGTACPCGNTGAAGNGCASSVNVNGANLAATGSAVVGADTVVLVGTGMSNSSVLYFQGTSQISIVFGDGLRCAGGTVIRLGTKTNVAGASQYPGPGNQSVSVRGMVPSGATRSYQAWYRNSAAFCTPSTFNLTNGLSITWQ